MCGELEDLANGGVVSTACPTVSADGIQVPSGITASRHGRQAQVFSFASLAEELY